MNLSRPAKKGSVEVVQGCTRPDSEQLGTAYLALPPDIQRSWKSRTSAWKTQQDDNGEVQICKTIWTEDKSFDPKAYHGYCFKHASGMVCGRVSGRDGIPDPANSTNYSTRSYGGYSKL